MNDFESLLCHLPPPVNPVDNSGDWQATEGFIGTSLPVDYKQFISRYGTIDLSNGIRVYNLLLKSDQQAALHTASLLQELYQGLHDDRVQIAKALGQSPDTVSPLFQFPIFPTPSGIFPWGTAVDGWDFFWIRNGQPEEWGVVVVYKAGDRCFPFTDLTFSGFLLSLFDKPFLESFRMASL
jgi:hypothetical protein